MSLVHLSLHGSCETKKYGNGVPWVCLVVVLTYMLSSGVTIKLLNKAVITILRGKRCKM